MLNAPKKKLLQEIKRHYPLKKVTTSRYYHTDRWGGGGGGGGGTVKVLASPVFWITCR